MGPAVIPLIIIVGLLSGFGREIVLAYAFGTDRAIEVFRVAFALPSILTEAVAVSLISGLIGVILKGDSTRGFRIAWYSAILLAVTITLVGLGTMRWQAEFLAPGFDAASTRNLIIVGAICWLIVPFSMVSLPLRAWLSLEGKQWATSMSTALRGGFFIIAILIVHAVAADRTAIQAAGSAVFASIATLVIYYLLFTAGNRPTSSHLRSAAGIRWRELTAVTSALLTILISQLLLSGGRILDRILASFVEVGTLAAVEYSYALLMAGAALFATSANILLAPVIGRALKAEGRLPRKAWMLIAASVGSATGCGVIGWVFSDQIIELVYQRGRFDDRSAELTSQAFGGQVAFLGPLVLSLILVQVVILLGRARWLVVIALFKISLKLAAVLFLMPRLDGISLIVVTFGIAECGTAVLVTVITLILLNKRANSGESRVGLSTDGAVSDD